MIELTTEQRQALRINGETPPRFIDPETQTTYVLLPQQTYELLIDPDYDDSPWTNEEMELLAWEAGKLAGWDEMDEYDEDEEPQCNAAM